MHHANVRMGYNGHQLFADVYGEIDHHGASVIREAIDRELFRLRPDMLILNLEGISFMDSSGLGLVIGRVRAAEQLGATVKVSGASAATMRIFSLSGLERLGNLKIEGVS